METLLLASGSEGIFIKEVENHEDCMELILLQPCCMMDEALPLPQNDAVFGCRELQVVTGTYWHYISNTLIFGKRFTRSWLIVVILLNSVPKVMFLRTLLIAVTFHDFKKMETTPRTVQLSTAQHNTLYQMILFT